MINVIVELLIRMNRTYLKFYNKYTNLNHDSNLYYYYFFLNVVNDQQSTQNSWPQLYLVTYSVVFSLSGCTVRFKCQLLSVLYSVKVVPGFILSVTLRCSLCQRFLMIVCQLLPRIHLYEYLCKACCVNQFMNNFVEMFFEQSLSCEK